MYIATAVADRIRLQARLKNVTLKQMLADCGLSINTLTQMGHSGITSFNLAKIADYLDCSVDYLLCRTENPNAHHSHSSDISVNPYDDQQLMDIIKIYKRLSQLGKAKVYVFVDEVLKNDSSK